MNDPSIAERFKAVLQHFAEAYLTEEDQQRIQSIPTKCNEYGYDPFGFNREDLKIVAVVARWFYRNYFRCKVYGIENIPPGRVMLVANHSGQLPFDAMNIVAAVLFDGNPPRLARAMIDRFVSNLPYISYLFSRWGQILGTPENCKRLLEDDEAILVFPEGVKGISKPFSQRYQLQDFGLGFMRLALATQTPVVPIAVVGAEEQAPSINVEILARLLGVPSFPLMPFPPFFPILPLPVQYHIYFGAPQRFSGHPDEDEEGVEALVQQIRQSIESMLQAGLKQRQSIF